MYYAFEIDQELRDRILKQCPSKFEETICEHCTLVFSNFNTTQYQTNTPYNIKITKLLSNDIIQCVMCSIDGSNERPDEKQFHITISLDRTQGAKPVMSNQLIQDYFNNVDGVISEDLNPVINSLVYLKQYD